MKGCHKVVKNVVNIDIFMVVTLKVVKVVSSDNEKVVNLTPQIWYHVVGRSVVNVVTMTTLAVEKLSMLST